VRDTHAIACVTHGLNRSSAAASSQLKPVNAVFRMAALNPLLHLSLHLHCRNRVGWQRSRVVKGGVNLTVSPSHTLRLVANRRLPSSRKRTSWRRRKLLQRNHCA
jgi:hypothetical protein